LREAARTGRRYQIEHFDPRSGLPWNAEALTADLALTTLFDAMAAGDDCVFEVSRKVILSAVTCIIASSPPAPPPPEVPDGTYAHTSLPWPRTSAYRSVRSPAALGLVAPLPPGPPIDETPHPRYFGLGEALPRLRSQFLVQLENHPGPVVLDEHAVDLRRLFRGGHQPMFPLTQAVSLR
jgi:hypothetical protein